MTQQSSSTTDSTEGLMPRIDFAFGAPHRLRTACQVVHKNYLAGRNLLVYSSNAKTLQAFDRMLWSFEPTAFVPHAYASEPQAASTSVVLCEAQPLTVAKQLFSDLPWLINLDSACPPEFEQFERIVEIVSAQAEDRDAARERWRQYTSAGLAPKAHDLAASS